MKSLNHPEKGARFFRNLINLLLFRSLLKIIAARVGIKIVGIGTLANYQKMGQLFKFNLSSMLPVLIQDHLKKRQISPQKFQKKLIKEGT